MDDRLLNSEISVISYIGVNGNESVATSFKDLGVMRSANNDYTLHADYAAVTAKNKSMVISANVSVSIKLFI